MSATSPRSDPVPIPGSPARVGATAERQGGFFVPDGDSSSELSTPLPPQSPHALGGAMALGAPQGAPVNSTRQASSVPAVFRRADAPLRAGSLSAIPADVYVLVVVRARASGRG